MRGFVISCVVINLLFSTYCLAQEEDEQTNGVKMSIVEIDSNHDGKVEYCIQKFYDKKGNKTQETYTWECRKAVSTTYYLYNDRGELLTIKEDYDYDGEIDRCTTFTYSDGKKVTKEWDRDYDGKPDVCTYYTYNSQGKLATVRTDDGCDGKAVSCESHVCDKTGCSFVEKDCNEKPD